VKGKRRSVEQIVGSVASRREALFREHSTSLALRTAFDAAFRAPYSRLNVPTPQVNGLTGGGCLKHIPEVSPGADFYRLDLLTKAMDEYFDSVRTHEIVPE
jgi:hypothetical protein